MNHQETQEQLREALFAQERLRLQENRARLKTEALLKGLDVLTACDNTVELYQEILECLRTLIPFDSASVLLETRAGFLVTAAATDSRLSFPSFPAEGALLRALGGRASRLSKLARVKGWPQPGYLEDGDPSHAENALQSALVTPCLFNTQRMLLICASERRDTLNSEHLDLLKDFAPLAAQAVQRAQEKEKLVTLASSMEYQAHYDRLTGLPNRALFDVRLREIVRENKSQHAVLLIDVDDFKKINDTIGHLSGDLLLSEIGFRLSASVPRGSLIARMGGDEFAILIENYAQRECIEALCEQIQQKVARPLYFRNRKLQPTLSIGVVTGHDGATTTSGYLQIADIAMYQAKADGRNCYRFFDAVMQEKVEEEFNIESNLSDALTRREFSLVYQPIVPLSGGYCQRVEVLVRWIRDGQIVYSPDKFIPIAERTGFIRPLGDWILEQALTEMQPWLASSPNNRVCVNVAGVQLLESGFADSVIDTVSNVKVPCNQLELELSERFVADLLDEVALNNIVMLQRAGVSFAFDDFGTGQSSLLHLQKFPANTLKIDKSFIDGLATSDADQRLVRGLISLASHLGMDTVAEGVETQAQCIILRAMGCADLQGYYFSKPVALSEITALLDTWWDSSAGLKNIVNF